MREVAEFVADSDSGLGQNQARALLTYFYGYDFDISPAPIAIKPQIFIKPISNEELIVFPNPAEEVINVIIPRGSGSCYITMLDISGAVLGEEIHPKSDANSIVLHTSNLLSGLYLIRLRSETSENRMAKFVK